MIAVFLRELRENLKWAAVILALMLIRICHDIREPSTFLLFELARNWTILVAPLAGLLMGVVQTLFETKPDNWGFAVHRPVARRRIFIAKCAAGLLLLYGSLALPCLLAAAWAARPGHLPVPFQGRMVLPVLADVLNAGCYYFAAMVLTLRRARWHGTRLLPAAMGLASSAILVLFTSSFAQAMAVVLVAHCLGALAAWNVFSSNGEGSAAWARRLGLGAMMYPGAIGAGVFVIAFSQIFAVGGAWQYYQVDRDGNTVRVTQTLNRGERGWSFADPNGHPLPQYEGMDLDDPANADLFLRFTSHLVDENAVPWPLNIAYFSRTYRSPAPGVVVLRSVAPPGVKLRAAAVYNVEKRIIEMYDPISRERIGTVGPARFAAGPGDAGERFPGVPVNLSAIGGSRVLAFDSAVYWIEMDHRRARPVFTPPGGEAVFSAAEVGPPTDPLIVIATRTRLYLVRADGRQLFAAAIPADPAQYYFEPVFLPRSNHLLVRATPLPAHTMLHRRVAEYALDGALVRATEPPRLSPLRSPKVQETMMWGAICPPALKAVGSKWLLDEVLDLRSEEHPKMFDAFVWSAAILSAALSLIIGRRCGLGTGKAIAWSAANMLLGIAGVIVMLGLHEWPRRETCAACGKPRLVGRRNCQECGASMPPSPRDGREIFEPGDSFPAGAVVPA